MLADSPLRTFLNALLVAAPTTPPVAVTVVWWQQPNLPAFGYEVPVISMALSLLGLWFARQWSRARDKPQAGGKYLSGTMVIVQIAYVIDQHPTPGVAVALGVGVGVSGIAFMELFKAGPRQKLAAIFAAISAALTSKKETAEPPSEGEAP